MKIVKFLVEEEIKFFRQGIIEVDIEDASLLDTLKLKGKDLKDLTDDEKEKEFSNWAIGLFEHSLDAENSFADDVRENEKFYCDVSARTVDNSSPYFNKLPILKMEKSS
tara:strand:+ start:3621 stop:3947 length:327 start_codon:yes stop_codon:yes gene_type:complete